MRFLFLAFFITGCMQFDWQSGTLACGDEGECPSGMKCSQGYCVDGDDPWPDGSDSESFDSDQSPTDVDEGSDSLDDTNSAIECGDTVCVPNGDCDAVACEEQDGQKTCVHQSAVESCPAAECGVVECDTEDYSCRYLPVDEDCIEDEQCLEAQCAAEKEGDPPQCSTWMDEWLCESGYICSPSMGYKCEQGSCFGASVGEETQLTQLASKSFLPSISKSDDGFAVVWVDSSSGGYGQLYIYFLDHDGEPVPGTMKVVDVGTYVRNPVILYLGYKEGFAVVYQGWNSSSNTHEIFLVLLDSAGVYDNNRYPISDVSNSHSYYASAAFHATSKGVGIAWTDDRNKTADDAVQKDIYATVFDVKQRFLVAGNQRITNTENHEFWPEIVATQNGFVVAMQRKGEQVLTTRRLGTNAIPLGGLENIALAGTATRPLALAANDNDEIGIVWRDITLGSSKPRTVFALLDQYGKLSPKIADPVVVGGGLFSNYYPAEEIDYVGRLNLAWDTVRESFVFAWDGIPDGGSGKPDQAEILLSCISVTGAQADSPWQISFNQDRSIMPSLVVDGGFGVVVWHDNRNSFNSDALDGEVYKSTFGSNN